MARWQVGDEQVIEIIAQGAPATPYMRFGDRVRMAARLPSGETPFGAIDQRVVAC